MASRIYHVYGVRMASDFAFAVPLLPAAGPPDLEFDCAATAPVPVDWGEATAVCGAEVDPGWLDDWFTYYRLDGFDAVRLRDHADYYLFDDRIVCHLSDPQLRFLVDNQLFGGVFALWLERRGTLALHASAAAVAGRAVACIAPGRGGKTSLACALAAGGHPLLSEDLLPVRRTDTGLVADPGYPMVRLWPDQAAWFTGDVDGHPLAHPAFTKRRVRVGEGGFAPAAENPAPLRRLYFLDRHDDASAGVTIEPLQGQEALLGLVRASFLPVEVERFGWQGRRLEMLASLLHQAPAARLRYPSGFERLEQVVAAIEKDLDP